jgi:flagellar basal body rod protein FlgC
MSLFDAIDTAASGLSAERLRMDVTAENLANAQTTRGADGQPYRRKVVVLQEAAPSSFGSSPPMEMGARQPWERARKAVPGPSCASTRSSQPVDAVCIPPASRNRSASK